MIRITKRGVPLSIEYSVRKNMLKILLSASLLGIFTMSANASGFESSLGADSAYTVTETVQSGENTITVYEINKQTNELIPSYFRIELKKNFGENVENAVPIYFKWSDNKLVTGTQEDYSLVFFRDPSKDYDRINSGTNSADINHGFSGIVSSNDNGGAVSNRNGSQIGNIWGDFVGNSAILGSGRYQATGGAIYNNNAEIGNITGNFIGNYAQTYGGAIYNENGGIIGNITGDFIGNSSNSVGGAIYNEESHIGHITGDFIGNRSGSSGSAIDNRDNAVIESITGSFIGNTSYGSGGTIINTNDSEIGSITGNFINNSTIYEGGAINNSAIIGDITGDFINNSSYNNGGAIRNRGGQIGNITGNFINNSAGSSGNGGAIYNYGGIIGNITADIGFIGNSSLVSAGVIYNGGKGQIGNITGDFIRNSSNSGASAIQNDATIGNINGDFIYNTGGFGGAIYNSGTIGSITGDFIGNSADEIGGAIWNADTIDGFVTGNFIGNSAGDSGGAIYNTGENGIISGIINSSFIDNHVNYAGNPLYGGFGGAIYTSVDLSIIADNGFSIFSGNYIEKDGVRDDNAIYINTEYSDPTLTFELKNGGVIVMEDNIDGYSPYKVNIKGDNTDNTTFYMLNDIRNSDLSVGNTSLNTINDLVHTYNVNSFTLTGNTNFIADVDLEAKTMDRVSALNYGTHSGKLNVIGMNLLNDAPEGRDITEIFFAEPGLMNNVTNGTNGLPDAYQTAYTPIYRYNVTYETREDDGGYFLFTRGGLNGSGNSSDAFNPAVLNAPVSSLAAGQATVNETFKYIFEHADAFTQLPAAERMVHIKNNYYAISTDFNNNIGTGLAQEFNNFGAWVRPYVTFESMNLNNGPDVDAITYGTLIGFDSDFQDIKNGWTGVTTGYVGYNGSQLSYSGVDTSMNGGLLGITQTFYKGNFWTALTATAGASVGETSNMYGSENFTSLLAGIGSKTGYNFEFKEGKYIIQPIMFLSYTFVNTFDYTNSAGVKIESDPLHTIQLNPSVRFIMNLKDGWQPYASVGMVWNLLNQTETVANNIALPEMHIKPYVEYGLGVQKRWSDKFTAFFQTMIRNGGRNGIALTGGFRWSIGTDPSETVNSNNVKKVIKTLNNKVAAN